MTKALIAGDRVIHVGRISGITTRGVVLSVTRWVMSIRTDDGRTIETESRQSDWQRDEVVVLLANSEEPQ